MASIHKKKNKRNYSRHIKPICADPRFIKASSYQFSDYLNSCVSNYRAYHLVWGVGGGSCLHTNEMNLTN